MLGPVRAWRNGVEIELGPPKRRALLALLLVRSGTPVSLSEIVDVLWQRDPPNSAVNVVHRHVGVLRRLLGTGLVRGSGGYRLDTSGDAVDLLRFRSLGGQARAAVEAGSADQAAELLVQALSLWQGGAATGIPEEIRTHPVFTAVDHEYLAAVTEAAEVALAANASPALERILGVLRRAAADHPLDEALQARLIRVLAVTGHQAEALTVHREVRDRLADQLGVDPGAELRAAHEAVLHQTAAPPAHRPAAVRPAQLPPDLTGFGGRHTELATAGSLLPPEVPDSPDATSRTSATLLITAVGGMAGVGKTTLAVHWAHRVAHRFPDGQLYVNLRGFDPTGRAVPPAEALGDFLHALGVHPQEIPQDLDAKAALYRSLLAGRRVLLLLDNARDAEQVRPLLPGTPGCLVIVTSRDQLHGLIAAEGARPLTLGPLTTEEAREVMARRMGADRVAGEPKAVDAIIARCGHLPLALAVVAARAAANPTFSLAALAEELRESHGGLDALSGFSGGDPATDARSVFSWSYRALDPEAARLFRLLAVHPGADVSAPAAASLAGRSPRRTRALLAELTGAHLLTEHAPTRYACHDLLRAYAVELADEHPAAETHAARRRVLDHYLRSAHAAAATLLPQRMERIPLPEPAPGAVPESFTDTTSALRWLTVTRPVLLAAAEQAAATGLPTHAWQLAACLDRFLDRQGHWQDQLTLHGLALDAATHADDWLGQAYAHRSLGFAHDRLGQGQAYMYHSPSSAHDRLGHRDKAGAHLRRALGLFTMLGDRHDRALTHRYLAYHANFGTRYREALGHYREALGHYRAESFLPGQASALNETGMTHILRGEYGLALTQCRESLDLHQRLADRVGEASAWHNLGCAHQHLGEHDQALACYRHALDIHRGSGDRAPEADVLHHIGDTHQDRGDTDSARDTWRCALAILDDLGHPDGRLVREKLHPTATPAGSHQGPGA